MVKWDNRYELGNERIDSEHRVLLGLIVDFEESTKQGAAKEELHRILDEFIKYAEYHFICEEKLMTDCQYPEQKHHARMHNILLEDFIDKFWKFKREVMAADELLRFLAEWFAHHVLTEDKKLVGHIGK